MFCSRVCVWLLGPLFGAKAENTRQQQQPYTSTFVLTRIRPGALRTWAADGPSPGADLAAPLAREAASKTIKRLVPGRPGLAAVISPTSCELYRRPKCWTPNLLFSGDAAKPTRELNTRLTAICNQPPNERRKSCRAKSLENFPTAT
jgi:hypothetical protein